MFGVERVFCQNDMKTGSNEWFFSAREGFFGPFPSKEQADRALEEFVRRCIKNGDDGGRSAGHGHKLSLVPLNGYPNKKMEVSKGSVRWRV